MGKLLDFAETWFQRVWTEEDGNAIDELFVIKGPAKGLGSVIRKNNEDFQDPDLMGPEEFKQFHKSLLSLISNVEVRVLRSMEDDNWIFALCELSALKKGTDQKVKMTGTVVCRIVDGQINEAYNHWDFMSIFEHLGQLPENTFGQCLSGKCVG